MKMIMYNRKIKYKNGIIDIMAISDSGVSFTYYKGRKIIESKEIMIDLFNQDVLKKCIAGYKYIWGLQLLQDDSTNIIVRGNSKEYSILIRKNNYGTDILVTPRGSAFTKGYSIYIGYEDLMSLNYFITNIVDSQ